SQSTTEALTIVPHAGPERAQVQSPDGAKHAGVGRRHALGVRLAERQQVQVRVFGQLPADAMDSQAFAADRWFWKTGTKDEYLGSLHGLHRQSEHNVSHATRICPCTLHG